MEDFMDRVSVEKDFMDGVSVEKDCVKKCILYSCNT